MEWIQEFTAAKEDRKKMLVRKSDWHGHKARVGDSIPLMPIGQAADMGLDKKGIPLIDPRLFDSYEFARNPHPYFKIMRDHYPVYHDQLHNVYYITRYEDCRRCANDDLGFNTIPKGRASTVLGNAQLELSGIEHRRRRGLYDRYLVGQALKKRQHAIESLAREMISDWNKSDASGIESKNGIRKVELGSAFCNEFPVRVVSGVLGLPKEAQNQFLYWYQSMMAGFGGSATAKLGLQARQDLEDYVASIVESRRENPTFLYDEKGDEAGEDIISMLCRTRIDNDFLSTEEITSTIALLVGGGGDTTRGAIMNMWYLVLLHPEQLAALKENSDLWTAAFQETLRFAVPAGASQPKHTTFDIEVSGTIIPAGSLVLIMNHSANRDERFFSSAEKFNIFREDLHMGKMLRNGVDKNGQKSHLGFGIGSHFCPGAHISQQEAIVCSKILLDHFKTPELDSERTLKDIDGITPAPIGELAISELWLKYPI
ncbi:MAG: hypothetical protein CMQ40_08070 [Gammaproteobacteria bacterium]|nr:hypothetical protein [Gammaproteobacteria bacterium]